MGGKAPLLFSPGEKVPRGGHSGAKLLQVAVPYLPQMGIFQESPRSQLNSYFLRQSALFPSGNA